VCDGLTAEEIQQNYPEEFELRRRDKLHYRYRGNGGESYLDVVFRLQGVIVEIERLQTHVLLIAHRVVARILLAYYLNLSHHVTKTVLTADIHRTSPIWRHLSTHYSVLSRNHMALRYVTSPSVDLTDLAQVRKFEYREELDWFVECQLSPGGL
jgi:hypothetical protein